MSEGEFYDWQTGGGGGDLVRLAKPWEAAGVKWCVIGDLAVNHWAKEPLITKDADIVVAFRDLTLALESARSEGFTIKAHRFLANLEGEGQLAIQVTADPRYAEMADWASMVDLLGMRLPVAALEDSFQGKLWAWSDPERRPLNPNSEVGGT